MNETDRIRHLMEACCLCPRECGVNRLEGKKGFCGVDAKVMVARAALHMWEEPCISGKEGSGAVFFSGCSLGCGFCQNRRISRGQCGKQITIEHLVDIFLNLQEQKANNINLVTAGQFLPQVAEALKRAKAQELNSPYYEVTRKDTEIIRNTRSGIDFSFKNEYYGNTVFSIPFIAVYQVMNSSLALKTIEVLKDVIPVSADAVKKGLLETRWQGRMETVLPGVIVDGAHNEDGVAKFVETAAHFQKEYPLTLLFSAVDDKDYTDMIRTILDKIQFKHVVVTQVGGYRKVPAEHLAEIFRENGCPSAEVCDDAEEAFKKALAVKGEDGLLFCVGSLYLVGEIKTAILKGIGK